MHQNDRYMSETPMTSQTRFLPRRRVLVEAVLFVLCFGALAWAQQAAAEPEAVIRVERA